MALWVTRSQQLAKIEADLRDKDLNLSKILGLLAKQRQSKYTI